MLSKKERDDRIGVVFRIFGLCIISERKLEKYLKRSRQENKGFCNVMRKKKYSVDYCRGYEDGNDNVYNWLLRAIKK